MISWDRLKKEGILEPRLASAIWPAGLSEYVLPTLESLGLTFPLEKDRAGGLVVLLSLKPGRPERVAKAVNEFSKLKPALSAGWEIFQGVPPGAIEKLLTRCASFGGVRTFWRSGVLVHGGLDQQDESEIFMMVLQYSSGDNELTAHVHGDIGSPAPWVALSYVMSAVRVMLIEFPGLRSKGHLECPQHGDKMLLNTEVGFVIRQPLYIVDFLSMRATVKGTRLPPNNVLRTCFGAFGFVQPHGPPIYTVSILRPWDPVILAGCVCARKLVASMSAFTFCSDSYVTRPLSCYMGL